MSWKKKFKRGEQVKITFAKPRRGRRLPVVKIRMPKWRESRINEDTREASCGPLSLDVSLARYHGYSEKQIDRMEAVIRKTARKEGLIATRRFPERTKLEDDVAIFVGPCCLCDGKATRRRGNGCPACVSEGRNGKRITL